jgi:hypothetical protein
MKPGFNAGKSQRKSPRGLDIALMIEPCGIIKEQREKDANSQQCQLYHTLFISSNVPYGNEFRCAVWPVSYPA